MAEANPFALEDQDRQGPDLPVKSKVWTEDEQKEKLKGYINIPPQLWEHIKTNSHVRYYTKKEGFRTGGFVMKNPYDYTPKGETAQKRSILLQNHFNTKQKNHASWPAAYEDIESIHVKGDALTILMISNMEEVVGKMNKNFRTLAAKIEELQQEKRR